MIEISQIRLPCGTDRAVLEEKIRKILRLRRGSLFAWHVSRHAVDARKKPLLFDVWSVIVKPEHAGSGRKGAEAYERALVSACRNSDVRYVKEITYQFPETPADAGVLRHPPVVVGMGPAGLFAALMLARAGYRPIVLERGRPVEKRAEDVRQYWKTGTLDPDSNIQFGEGGAGTFSDGKLTTNVRDAYGRGREVLETFVRAGAPGDILYENLPHIGTDLLRQVVTSIREEILRLGGEIRFETCMEWPVTVPADASQDEASESGTQGADSAGPDWTAKHPEAGILKPDGTQGRRRLAGAVVRDASGRYFLETECLIMAPGHSARDLMRELYREGLPMTCKNFAVGFRLSHPQSLVNQQQYGVSDPGEMARRRLSPASYKLTAKAASGRGVYSFCMCPGGWIVDASSERGGRVVNGMSEYARGSRRANSAIVMTVDPRDFGSEDVLAGLHFQERLEQKAFRLGEGLTPVESWRAFSKGEQDRSGELDEEEKEALCIRGRAAWAPLHELLPADMTDDFRECMESFDRTIPGYTGPEAYMAGLESRTSSPVRILRDQDLCSCVEGLYPCGEGAGYAGGIMSAAIDGIRTAEAAARAFKASAVRE